MPVEKTPPLPVGTLLDGKFRITKEIGRGGMAAVYEALNIDIGKRVAVKVLAAELVSSRTVNERFIREARAAAAIRSPYICDVYDVGTFDDRPFLVMELLEGESLYDRLSHVRRLDPAATIGIAVQVCKGLTKAHDANIVHRDLKPENIFLTRDEDGHTIAKIVDFGLAKFYEPAQEGGAAARLTKDGALFGTPAYMSPEQAKAQGGVDHRADLWALACIVYECLTGRTVWNVEQGVAMILAQIAGAPIPRPSRFREDLPKSFDDWFALALDRNVNRRFQTAREFADSLELAFDPAHAGRSPLVTDPGTLPDLQDGFGSSMISETIELPAPRQPDASGTVEPVASDDVAALPPSSMPPPKARGPGLAIAVLLATSAVALGGYGAWFYVLHPSERGRVARAVGLSQAPGVSSAEASRQGLAETEPFALQIAAAQEALSRGQTDAAVKQFRGAFEASQQQKAARSFMNHAEVIGENPPTAGCKITGLGRPRSFAGSADASSIPTVAPSGGGFVAAWAETDPQTRKRHAQTTYLDASLRRVSSTVDATPEAKLVQSPALDAFDDTVSFLYWDSAPDGSGVTLRKLDGKGLIAGPPIAVSSSAERQSFPSLTRDPNGRLWVAWTVKDGARISNLMARRFDKELRPEAEAARLTRYRAPVRGNAIPTQVSVAVAHGFLNLAFALEHGVDRHVFALRVPLAEASLSTGGLAAPGGEDSKEPDGFLGQIIAVSTTPGQHNRPALACVEDGCFIAWDDEKAGAHVAFYSGSQGEVIWRRELGAKALSPTIAASGSEVVIGWYDVGRVRLARLGRDGLGEPALIGRASGYQPPPNIVAGAKRGEWAIGFREFEAGQTESFIVRAECK